MLRKKLLAHLGLLVVGFVFGAVVSITLLQGVLRDLDAMKADADATNWEIRDLNAAVSAIERQSAEPAGAPTSGAGDGRLAALSSSLDALGARASVREDRLTAEALSKCRALVPALREELGAG